jgi:tetratricopeptide (TPR) repeat protein
MVLRRDPKHLPSLSKAALLNFEMGRLDESVRHYKTINLLYPKNAQAYFNLAASLSRADRSREAKTALEKYLELAPSDPEGYKDMADVMIELGEKNTAVQILQKCL